MASSESIKQVLVVPNTIEKVCKVNTNKLVQSLPLNY